MLTKNIIFENRYYDSVVLMSAASKVKDFSGASQVSLMMGTDANKDLLRSINLLTPEGKEAGAGDLIVSLVVENEEQAKRAIQALEEALASRVAETAQEHAPRSIDGALELLPGANLAVISIPGEHVEWEANRLLDRGIHLMIFSNNVPLETEIALKKKGEELGLLVMGPDCGTAIIGGAALGFANKIRRGNIGIVGAAGTGIQEVSTIIHRMGGGISHAIGTGGRDLLKEVGGITMKMGIHALINDPATTVLCLISKPPHPDVEKEIYDLLEDCEKPVVICFLGSEGKEAKARGFKFANNLEETALEAIRFVGIEAKLPVIPDKSILIESLVKKLAPSQKYLRGLFSGGTLTSESYIILKRVGIQTWSNATKDPDAKMKDPFKSHEHTIVDMGDDVFTKGAPHPMIDSTKRIARLLEEAEDPETAIILMDLVLGFGAHPDPAMELAESIKKAQKIAADAGRHLIFIASVCGVSEDPQNYEKQRKTFEEAGVLVFSSNTSATRFVGHLIKALRVNCLM